MRIVRKLLTRPVWRWERKRNYPVRSEFAKLPSLTVLPGPRRFVVLTTRGTMHDALWAAWSWYRFLRNDGFELEIAVDGEVPQDGSCAAARMFPGVKIYSAESACAYVCERVPALATFLHSYPMGRKLALMLALSDQGPVLYSDSDVLAFNPPGELLSNVSREIPCYFMEEVDGTRDSFTVDRAHALGLDCLPRFNSGFVYLPKGTLSMELAAQILATWRPPGNSWFAEQTVLSVLLRSCNAQALPPSRYVISAMRQFYWEKDVDYKTIVARHFTGTVRHVMYRYGMPAVLEQSRSVSM